MSASGAEGSGSQRALEPGLCLLLVGLTFLVFAPIRGHDFVSYDDVIYIVENPNLRTGLGLDSIATAFTRAYEANWIPLTWLSLHVDAAIHGIEPSGFHTTNLALHAASTVLLLLGLRRLTGQLWPSAWCAAVFAVHPLHVESVAWASERKDALSGLFWMLTLLAYAHYVPRPSSPRYLAVLAALAGGLLAKSSLVALPFCLLLLDAWPLGRLGRGAPREGSRRALLEKLPLFAAAIAVGIVTIAVQGNRGAMEHGELLPLGLRLANAIDATVWYLAKSVWPTDLAVFYPHPLAVVSPAATAIGASCLAGISVFAALRFRSAPHLAVGWFWFAITLAPTLGVIQVGMQAHADRYAYLALTGLTLIVAFAARDLAEHRPGLRLPVIGCALASVVALAIVARAQVDHWSDSTALFERAIAVTDDNYLAERGLAEALLEDDHWESAETHARTAVRIQPNWPDAHVTLGDVLTKRGQEAAAMRHYRRALDLAPEHARANTNLGVVLIEAGRASEAIDLLERAIEGQRDIGHAHLQALLAQAHAHAGDVDAAVHHYESAIAKDPRFAEAHANLGFALFSRGEIARAETALARAQELGLESREISMLRARLASDRGELDTAVAHYRSALVADPSWHAAANNLAWLLATRSTSSTAEAAEAVSLAERAVATAGPDPALLDTHAAALARAGRFDAAASSASRGAELARASGDDALAAEIESRAARYRTRRPYDAPVTEPGRR